MNFGSRVGYNARVDQSSKSIFKQLYKEFHEPYHLMKYDTRCAHNRCTGVVFWIYFKMAVGQVKWEGH